MPVPPPCPCSPPRIPGLPVPPCSCSPPKIPGLTESLGVSTSVPTPVSSVLTNSPLSTIQSGSGSDEEKNLVKSDHDNLFTASVAELRRKAQEHSAALWQR